MPESDVSAASLMRNHIATFVEFIVIITGIVCVAIAMGAVAIGFWWLIMHLPQ